MRHPFALEPLATHLRQPLPGFGRELTAQQFTGGHSNPTYLLQAGGQRWVLRRKRSGRASLPNWDYYMAFNMFRMAAILQGILYRALHGCTAARLHGSAASAEAEQTGRLARPMAEAGWRRCHAERAAKCLAGSPPCGTC